MKILLETLGSEAAVRFLTFALPQFEQRSQELLASLRAGNMESAAACAHKLKGTVHLYASPELQTMLGQIATHDRRQLQSEQFLRSLEEKIVASKNDINLFISKH